MIEVNNKCIHKWGESTYNYLLKIFFPSRGSCQHSNLLSILIFLLSNLNINMFKLPLITSLDEQKSSDMVFDTLVKTQKLHQDNHEMLDGACSNDNIKNTGVSEVLTSDLVLESTTQPTGLINEHVETMSLKTMGELRDLHTMQMESPSASPIILILTPWEQTSFHPYTIDDLSEHVDEKIVIEGPTSSGDLSANFIHEWLQSLQHDNEAGPSSNSLLPEEQLQTLYALTL